MKTMKARNRSTRKRGGNEGKLTGVSTPKLLLSSQLRGVVTYNTVVGKAPAAGAVDVQVFRMNSVYDPDFTGIGSSIPAYSQLSAMYGRYRVLACKITVSFVNTSAATPLTCFVACTPATTVGVSMPQIMGQRHVWAKSIGSYNSQPLTHVVNASVGKVYGVPELQVLTEDDFAAVVGTNPNNGVYAHIGLYANGPVGATANLHVRIEYDVVWSLPLELA